MRSVVARALNVRSGPSSKTAIVGVLRDGDAAYLLGESKGSWVKVKAGENGDEGWVFSKYLREVEDS